MPALYPTSCYMRPLSKDVPVYFNEDLSIYYGNH